MTNVTGDVKHHMKHVMEDNVTFIKICFPVLEIMVY